MEALQYLLCKKYLKLRREIIHRLILLRAKVKVEGGGFRGGGSPTWAWLTAAARLGQLQIFVPHLSSVPNFQQKNNKNIKTKLIPFISTFLFCFVLHNFF